MPLYVELTGEPLSPEATSILHEALCFAEGRLKEAPQNEVLLRNWEPGFEVMWVDGNGRMLGRMFHVLSAAKPSPLPWDLAQAMPWIDHPAGGKVSVRRWLKYQFGAWLHFLGYRLKYHGLRIETKALHPEREDDDDVPF